MKPGFRVELIDYSLRRRLKPALNIAVYTTGWMIVVVSIALLFSGTVAEWISAFFLLAAALSISTAVVLAMISIFRKRMGIACVTDDHWVIGERRYALHQVELRFNATDKEWADQSLSLRTKIDRLPVWGNFLVTNDGLTCEFRPETWLAGLDGWTPMTPARVGGYWMVSTWKILKRLPTNV